MLISWSQLSDLLRDISPLFSNQHRHGQNRKLDAKYAARKVVVVMSKHSAQSVPANQDCVCHHVLVIGIRRTDTGTNVDDL